MSLLEAFANVAAGYVMAVVTQAIVFPLFGLWMSIGVTLEIGAIFTAVSIVRSFALRRLFETLRIRHAERETAARLRAADDRTSEVD
jgi:hypothetical protein